MSHTEKSKSVRFLSVVTALMFIMTLLRGLRMPDNWAWGQYLINYDFGFIKRGLVGTITHGWGSSHTVFVFISAVIVLSNLWLIWSIVREYVYSQKWLFVGAALIFVTSMAPVYIGHTIGYLDHIGLLVALLVTRQRRPTKKLFIAVVGMTFAILIHEVNAVLFMPVIIFSLLLSANKQSQPHRYVLLVLTCSVALLLLTMGLSNRTLTARQAESMRITLEDQTGGSFFGSMFAVVTRDSSDNTQLMRTYWLDPSYRHSLSESFLVTLPVAILLLYVTYRGMRQAKIRLYYIVLGLLAPLSPLILHLVAWDMQRWNTWLIVTCFIASYASYQLILHDGELLTKESKMESSLWLSIVILMVYINGASTIPLFDRKMINFPFIESQNSLWSFVTQK